MSEEKPVRHLLGLSGGKDSAALAIYMRDKIPEMEYFFADTGAELPETLEFVDSNGFQQKISQLVSRSTKLAAHGGDRKSEIYKDQAGRPLDFTLISLLDSVSGSVWEGRYEATLLDSENYLLTCSRYIELNPVRAGMVNDPAEYPWSSYHYNALGIENRLLKLHSN